MSGGLNFDQWAHASQVGVQNFSKKAIGFAQDTPSNNCYDFDGWRGLIVVG